jgi:hypothetical protein
VRCRCPHSGLWNGLSPRSIAPPHFGQHTPDDPIIDMDQFKYVEVSPGKGWGLLNVVHEKMVHNV